MGPSRFTLRRMAARSIGSGIISFGLVTIPVKLYTAASSEAVSFNKLHATCGGRVKQQLLCPTENNLAIEHADTVRGFEYAPDQFVRVSDEEYEELKGGKSPLLALIEFVPASTVDLVCIEKSYYLGPDKGPTLSYRTLALALASTDRVGVGRFALRGKDSLVLIRAYRGGLVMHEAYYDNEVRPWDEVPMGDVSAAPGPQHIAMAELLIKQLEKPALEPARFRDEWADKVKAFIEAKVAGAPPVVTPKPKPHIIDLLDALQRSVAANAAKIEDLTPARATESVQPKVKKAVPRKAVAKKRRDVDAS